MLNLGLKKSPHCQGAGFFLFIGMRQPAPLLGVPVVVIIMVCWPTKSMFNVSLFFSNGYWLKQMGMKVNVIFWLTIF
ncbi:hypothetical protein FCN80_01210 [Martelella alba]|uniref:Uncharacterized protein n=1 Tax=Martelella alba TaxID=2590451 RepID=A0ABY2SR55_9HYPH|nr:hypothetical protein FCN80_01210 [Martelella alba]